MSSISVTTLKDNASNNQTSILNAIHGSAKAWVNYDHTANNIKDSFNIDSVTDNGTGIFTVNFTINFSNANYAYTHGHGNNANYMWFIRTPTVLMSSCSFETWRQYTGGIPVLEDTHVGIHLVFLGEQ